MDRKKNSKKRWAEKKIARGNEKKEKKSCEKKKK